MSNIPLRLGFFTEPNMDMVEEMLESACAELEACGHPELAAEIKVILAKVEAIEEEEVPAAPDEE
jgi:hypothetical protein